VYVHSTQQVQRDIHTQPPKNISPLSRLYVLFFSCHEKKIKNKKVFGGKNLLGLFFYGA
jgi:hypothetical protein